MKTKLLLAASAMLALTACDQLAPKKAEEPAAPPPVVLPTEADGVALFDKIKAAVASNDPAQINALYAPGAIMLSTSTNAIIKSPEALAADTAEYVKMKATPVVNTRDVQVLDADTIVTTGTLTLDFKRGARDTWIAVRVTDVWQKQADGAWLVVNEHLSALPKPVPARLAPLEGAPTAEQADAPPLGGSAPAPVPAPEPEKK